MINYRDSREIDRQLAQSSIDLMKRNMGSYLAVRWVEYYLKGCSSREAGLSVLKITEAQLDQWRKARPEPPPKPVVEDPRPKHSMADNEDF